MAISLPVLGVVLFAAFCHAGWNAVVKSGPDKLFGAVLVSAGCGAIAAVALPFLPQPQPASWPFIIASVVAQILYSLLLAAAYQAGDMSQTYPIMRGVAPVLVAVASGPVVGEMLSPGRWLGIALISLGITAIALLRRPDPAHRWAGLPYALLNACTIASYTVIDGMGVRRAGSPIGYAFWTYVLTAIPLVAGILARYGPRFRAHAAVHWPVLVVGGTGTLASYTLALWAMTMAPVAVVASLRETSILFGTVLSVVFLRERLAPGRLGGIALIVIGAAVIRGV